MDIRKPGTYGFMVSSQDCSFLLIDDKPVVSAPGSHGPMRRAFRGSRHDVRLNAGLHKFEYYHAAAGSHAMMVARLGGRIRSDSKPLHPTVIPSEVFHAHLIGRLPANHLALRTARQVPDFVAKLVSDVPLPDNDVPLVGVLFRDVSPKALTMQGAKLEWDFGDGQTSDLPNADHVYLRPGLYAVKLSVRRGGKTVETTNRIYVDRPRLDPQRQTVHVRRLSPDHRDLQSEDARRGVAAANGVGVGGEGAGRGQSWRRRRPASEGSGSRPQPPARYAAEKCHPQGERLPTTPVRSRTNIWPKRGGGARWRSWATRPPRAMAIC